MEENRNGKILSLGMCGWGRWFFIRFSVSDHVHVTEEQQLNFPTTRSEGFSFDWDKR